MNPGAAVDHFTFTGLPGPGAAAAYRSQSATAHLDLLVRQHPPTPSNSQVDAIQSGPAPFPLPFLPGTPGSQRPLLRPLARPRLLTVAKLAQEKVNGGLPTIVPEIVFDGAYHRPLHVLEQQPGHTAPQRVNNSAETDAGLLRVRMQGTP